MLFLRNTRISIYCDAKGHIFIFFFLSRFCTFLSFRKYIFDVHEIESAMRIENFILIFRTNFQEKKVTRTLLRTDPFNFPSSRWNVLRIFVARRHKFCRVWSDGTGNCRSTFSQVFSSRYSIYWEKNSVTVRGQKTVWFCGRDKLCLGNDSSSLLIGNKRRLFTRRASFSRIEVRLPFICTKSWGFIWKITLRGYLLHSQERDDILFSFYTKKKPARSLAFGNPGTFEPPQTEIARD